jgi:hypothetical protein
MGFWSPKYHGGDLAQMPQRLNKLSIRISEADLRCSSMDPVLDCLTHQLKDLADGSCPGTKIELQEQVEFIRQRVWGVRVLIQRRREGVQSMVQTVRPGNGQSPTQVLAYSPRCMRYFSNRTIGSITATVLTCD